MVSLQRRDAPRQTAPPPPLGVDEAVFDDDGLLTDEEDIDRYDEVQQDVDVEITSQRGESPKRGSLEVVLSSREEDEAEVHGEMDFEINEIGDDSDSSSAGNDDESVLYFSVSIWKAKGLLGNNDNGTRSDPYVLAKYGTQELKTRVIRDSRNPVWKSHVMFQHAEGHEDISLYVFDHEEFTSDDILGKAVVQLPTPLPPTPVFTVADKVWFAVQPCLTSEQDELSNQQHMRRRLTKTVRIFHDDAHLFKCGSLGELQVSVTCFRLEELPKLVREREVKIEELRSKLSQQRRLHDSDHDATLRLQTQVQALKREAARAEERASDADRKRRDAETARDAARARIEVFRADKLKADADRARDATQAQADARALMDKWRAKVAAADKLVSRAENDRDHLAIKVHKLEKLTAASSSSSSSSPGTHDDHGALQALSAEELQDRIHGLTLAYYWKKRNPHKPMNEACRKHVNKFSLPGDAPLRLEAKTNA